MGFITKERTGSVSRESVEVFILSKTVLKWKRTSEQCVFNHDLKIDKIDFFDR